MHQHCNVNPTLYTIKHIAYLLAGNYPPSAKSTLPIELAHVLDNSTMMIVETVDVTPIMLGLTEHTSHMPMQGI